MFVSEQVSDVIQEVALVTRELCKELKVGREKETRNKKQAKGEQEQEREQVNGSLISLSKSLEAPK